MQLPTICSGGAPGADTGALRAAKLVGAPTTGFVTPNFPRKMLPTYGLAQRYDIVTHADKDMANVDISDFLVAFVQWDTATGDIKENTGQGTIKTINYAFTKVYAVPWFPIVYEDSPIWFPYPESEFLVIFIVDGKLADLAALATELSGYLQKYGDGKTVMVSGPTERTLPGIEDAVCNLLQAALRHTHETPCQ